MSKLNEDGNIIATQSNNEEKIGEEALAVMQKSFEEIDKLANAGNKNVVDNPIDTASEILNEAEVESENKDSVAEEVEIKKEKVISKEDKYRKLQNDKYKAKLAEKEALKRVSELEHLLDEALHSGSYHYSKSVSSDIDRAKQKMEVAIENGDNKAFVEANIELTEAIHAANDLKKWEAQDKRNWETQNKRNVSVVPVRNVEPEYNDVVEELAYDWLDTHSYLQPNSRDYNPILAREVSNFVNNLDSNLRRNNEMDLFFTPDYFDTIDNFIYDNIEKTRLRNAKSVQSSNHIGGVRHGTSVSVNGNSRAPTQVFSLSADEKRWCKDTGTSEKSMLEAKMEYAREGK